jgi:hypothetical protein
MTSASNRERRRRKATARHGTGLHLLQRRTPKRYHHHHQNGQPPIIARGVEITQGAVRGVEGEWPHEVRELGPRANASVVSIPAAAVTAQMA